MSATDLTQRKGKKKNYRRTKGLEYMKLFWDNTGYNIYYFLNFK